ncbi:MAG: phage portal protein, partial [Planctomycetota bacterium]
MTNFVKASVVGGDSLPADASGRSAQLPEDSWDYDRIGAKEPPYSLDALALFLEVNTFHLRCVKAKAISTAGLGFDFIVPDEIKAPDPKNKQALQAFFNSPNEECTWGEILENVLTDFEALGNGYFEVVRNALGIGAPTAIYHVPAVTVRVRKDKKGFIQQRDNKMVYFRNFGSDPNSPDSFDPRDKDKPENQRRPLTEIIHLKNYHPRSSYYGLPDFLPALRALVGNKQAGDFNIQFFENNAIPQYAIIVKGGELAKGTRKRIEEYFRTHIKGSAHKTLILEIAQDGDEKVDIEIKPLSVDIRDASFRMFRSDNAEEIRVAHGVPGRLIGLTEKGGLGGAGEGATQQEIFKYHVIEPKQSRLEYRINNFLIRRGFGIQDWEIRFKEIDVTDEAKVAEIVQKLVKLGVLTINEGRREMGQKPLEHPGADIPFMMTSMGPLSLDTLEEGGVRLPMTPLPEEGEEEAKALAAVPMRKALGNDVERFRAQYVATLEKVLKGRISAIESLEFEGELKRVMAEAERILGPELAKEMAPATRRYLERAFKAGQALRGVPSSVKVLYDRPRRAAVDWLVGNDRFYLGKVFPEHVRDSFRDTIVRGMEGGLGRKDIGRQLRELMVGTPDAPGKLSAYTRVASA